MRQVAFKPFGFSGQKALLGGRVLLVGVGGLGSWVAELLARAGVGFLRLVDDDHVDFTNIHRQALYAQQDADSGRPKVEAAANRLRHINDACLVEAAAERLDRFNIDRLAQDIDVVIDGTDNFATRFVLNDYCVKKGLPWIFAGVVRTEAADCDDHSGADTVSALPAGRSSFTVHRT
jgi:adenylyltransferase/sulfurtransferase